MRPKSLKAGAGGQRREAWAEAFGQAKGGE